MARYDWDTISQQLPGAISGGITGMTEAFTTAPIEQKIGNELQILAFKQMAEDREREKEARAMQRKYMEEAIAAMEMDRKGRMAAWKAYQDDVKRKASLASIDESKSKGGAVEKKTSDAMRTARMASFGGGRDSFRGAGAGGTWTTPEPIFPMSMDQFRPAAQPMVPADYLQRFFQNPANIRPQPMVEQTPMIPASFGPSPSDALRIPFSSPYVNRQY